MNLDKKYMVKYELKQVLEMEKVNDIKEFYDGFADEYDAVSLSSTVNAQYHVEVSKIFLKYHYSSGSILDIGCGTGLIKDFLGDSFSYTGIDISSNMLKRAKARGFKVILGALEDVLLNIPDRSYDYALCLSTLYYIQDAYAIIEHLARIARQGVLLGIDHMVDEYVQQIPCPVYNHIDIQLPNLLEDYVFLGWHSPTLHIPINTRIIYFQPGA